MGLLNNAIKLTLMGSIALFFGLVVLVRILFGVLKHGPRAVFGKKPRYQPPPCLQNPELGTHGYVYLEEVRLHYVTTGAEGKPLMLLVHGFPEFWYSWRHQLKEFKNSYRVVAIDQRGYGDSDKPASVSSYDVSKLSADIKNLVSALGYKKCVLVGHDWGGGVAWRVAQRYPEIVEKLIIMNSPSSPAYAKLTRGKGGFSQLKKSWYFFFFQLPWLPEVYAQMRDFLFLELCFLGKTMGVTSGMMSKDDVEAYKYTFARGGFTAPINYYRQMLRSRGLSPPKEDHAKVSCPTLIIWGDHDMALEAPLAQYSSELSVEGGATVKMIEGASHWVQMDRPDLVNKYMREFLSRR